MKPRGMTPEPRLQYNRAACRRWSRKNRAYKREYGRASKQGTHRMWWTLACRKAGINV